MTIQRITIVGTGLIGASVGLALRAAQFPGEIIGWDRHPSQCAARAGARRGRCHRRRPNQRSGEQRSGASQRSGLCHSGLDGETRSHLKPHQLVTDVGSVKVAIAARALPLFGGSGQAGFLPGHPMAGKEVSGAANADAQLFTKLCGCLPNLPSHPLGRGVAQPGWSASAVAPWTSWPPGMTRSVPGSAICPSFYPPL